MQQLLTSLCAAGLSAVLAAQGPPRSTNSLEFQTGGKLEVAYNQIDLGAGATLDALTTKGEKGAGMRRMFNERLFKSRIGGALTIDTPTVIAGNDLDAGTYTLNFRIDEDLVWYLVVSTEDDEEIFATALAVQKDEKDADESSSRLVIRPLAEDNAERTGNLEIRFGPLAARVSFKASGDGHDDDDDDEKEARR